MGENNNATKLKRGGWVEVVKSDGVSKLINGEKEQGGIINNRGRYIV